MRNEQELRVKNSVFIPPFPFALSPFPPSHPLPLTDKSVN